MRPEDRCAFLASLNIAAGRLPEVRGMLEAGAPCLEVFSQLNEVQRALADAESLLLRSYLHTCLETIRGETCQERRLVALQELSKLHKVHFRSFL